MRATNAGSRHQGPRLDSQCCAHPFILLAVVANEGLNNVRAICMQTDSKNVLLENLVAVRHLELLLKVRLRNGPKAA